MSEDNNRKTELLFNEASCRVLEGNYQMALIDLFSITDTGKTVQMRLDFYLGTCYYGLAEFEKAGKYFSLCVRETDKIALMQLFRDRKLNSPSPKKARILSMILPGLGQTYSGDIKSGLNSIVLTSGLIVLGIRISAIYSPMDAVIAVLPWYQRYYTGGYGKAEGIAEKKLAKNRSEIYREILGIVEKSNEL
jgi:tetratricopeptide (TPR) repeat protein